MSVAEAEKLKQKGNGFYKTYNFKKADEVYTEALKKLGMKKKKCKLDNTSYGDYIALCMALHSNRGNSRFELGDYEGAAQDSRDVIEIISNENGTQSEPDEESLKKIEMNKWRLVRCLFYLNTDETEATLNGINSTITDPSLKKKCKKILDSMD